MKTLILIGSLLVGLTSIAQQLPNDSINGIYHLLKQEKGPSGKTNKMLIELAENNGTKMLAVAACEKCYPAIYTYKPELSKQFGKPVFYNSSGIHVLKYDNDSFIICMAAISIDKDFNYINFYSKSKSKVEAMTTKQMEAYANKILDYI